MPSNGDPLMNRNSNLSECYGNQRRLSLYKEPNINCWFHHHISGSEAEEILMKAPHDGSFLARWSTTIPESFCLSVRCNENIIHVRVQHKDKFFDLYGGERFVTLSELIQHYMKNNMLLRLTKGNCIPLRYPINCMEPTSERWFHGHLSTADSIALLSGARHGAFLIRESQSRPGNYVVSLKYKSLVVHVCIRFDGRSYDLFNGPKFSCLDELVAYYLKFPMVDSIGNVMILQTPFNTTRLQVKFIRERILQLKRLIRDSRPIERFWEEFDIIQDREFERVYCSQNVGRRPENATKNRFKNILPYDLNRVKLRKIFLPSKDYINASYINSTTEDIYHFVNLFWDGRFINNTGPSAITKTYIATQGCLENTIEDFWSMMWHENTRVIVMMSKLVEKKMTMTSKYWPDQGCGVSFGKFYIFNQLENQSTEYIMRVLTMTYQSRSLFKRSKTREIFQFQLLTWPEHGVPSSPGSILLLRQVVNDKIEQLLEFSRPPKKAVICVHCCSGIGRTGTYIAADVLVDRIIRKGLDCEIDILNTIIWLRSQRRALIQTEAQYRLIYLAIDQYVDTITSRLGHGRAIGNRPYENVNLSGDLALFRSLPPVDFRRPPFSGVFEQQLEPKNITEESPHLQVRDQQQQRQQQDEPQPSTSGIVTRSLQANRKSNDSSDSDDDDDSSTCSVVTVIVNKKLL